MLEGLHDGGLYSILSETGNDHAVCSLQARHGKAGRMGFHASGLFGCVGV